MNEQKAQGWRNSSQTRKAVFEHVKLTLPTRLLWLSLTLFMMWGNELSAQSPTPWNNLRQHWQLTTDNEPIDTLSVIPHSLRLSWPNGEAVDTSTYTLIQNRLLWMQAPATDSVWLRYRVFPYRFDQALALLDTSLLSATPTGLLIGSYDPYAERDPLLGSQKLNYTGSFSRGLSFGNRQDLVLNSSFNLQLGGEIGDGIRITAAITDENLPIQPEGNTRQLRDFDRIFIRLERDQSQLTAGDYELRNPDGYFMRFFRKLEGATFQTSQEIDADSGWKTQASVAIARGKFRRQQISALEGNQGPYKLQGLSGERFIIVLAGTEKVMLDGRPLVRGRDADYTIDYNQGEVVFTPKQLITKDSRITVEFEYADQRYLRSLYTGSARYESKRGEAYFNLYSQQDSKSSSGDLELSEAERLLLRESGDALSNTFISTIDTVGANAGQRATYQLIDTILVCNGRDSLVQFLRYDPIASFVASFAFVGEGQGDYVLDLEQTANERVFRYVAPDANCQRQGNYLPARQLAAPEQQRLFAAGGSYRTGKDGEVRAEVALSQLDLNRFSTLDADDDTGLAGRFDWKQAWQLSADSLKSWQLSTEAGFEHLQTNFRALNPYRSPEFLRDWSLADVNGIGSTAPAAEWLGQWGLALSRPEWGSLAYRWSRFEREDQYLGQRHAAELRFKRDNWTIRADNSWLNSESSTGLTRFIRPKVQIKKNFERWNNWTLGVEGQSERNERRTDMASDFSPNSFYFQRYAAELASPESTIWQMRTSARTRIDFTPVGTRFQRANEAREVELAGQWNPNKKWRSSAALTYRSLRVDQPELTTAEPNETLLGRVDLTATLWQNGFRSNTTYEIGSGQEPRIEFVYLFVGAGQGQYIWLDSLYNNDGKIQPNEMEIAPFPDIADHVRVSIFTDDFIRTDNVTINQSFQLDPARPWQKSEQGWQKFLARFNGQSSLSVNRKTRGSGDEVQSWNPLQLSLPDSVLVALSANQRHTLFFNRRSTKYDLQLERLIQARRLVPTTGFEARRLTSTTLRARWNITDATTLRLAMTEGRRSADSEFFNNKDYQLHNYSLEPSFNYQPGQDYRLQISYLWQDERNQLPESQEAIRRQEFKVEGNYQRSLRLSASYIYLELEGDPRSPVGFVLLNGLQTGRNWIWNASLTRQLGRYLQMTLTYEGRQTGEAPVVHVGRAQVTAIF